MTEESKTFGFLPLRSDRTLAPGTLSYSTGGALPDRGRGPSGPPLLRPGQPDRRGSSAGDPREVTIEGHAAMNASGKAVLLHTRAGSYIIPLVSFQRVARGEAISAPLFPLVPGNDGCDGLRPEVEKPTGFEPEFEHQRCEVTG
jgi:hypothetical protein|nr:hypothetical protein [Methanoculleus marisnigri]